MSMSELFICNNVSDECSYADNGNPCPHSRAHRPYVMEKFNILMCNHPMCLCPFNDHVECHCIPTFKAYKEEEVVK